jgi:hypothetical protein
MDRLNLGFHAEIVARSEAVLREGMRMPLERLIEPPPQDRNVWGKPSRLIRAEVMHLKETTHDLEEKVRWRSTDL